MSHSKKTKADNSPDNKNNIHDNAISKSYPSSSSSDDSTSSVAHNSAAPKNEGNQKILNDYSARADQTYDDASVFKRPNVNLRAVDDNISKKAIHATPSKSSSPSLLSSSSSSLLSSSASPSSSSSSALFSQSSTHSEHSRRVKRSRNNLKSSSSSSSFSSQSNPSENSLSPSDKLPSRSSSEISPSKTSTSESLETLPAATTTTTKYIIKLIYADSKCSDRFAPIAAIDMYVNKSVQAFLGPTCEFALAPIARYAAFWNIPILSAGIGSAAKAFNDKQEVFRMLTRMTSSFRQLGKFLVESLRQEFGWKYMPILYEKYFDGVHSSLGSASDECTGCEREARNIKSRRKNNNSRKEDNRPQPCYFTMEAIFDELTTGGRSLYRAEVDSTNIYERVHNVSKRGRIILMCASNKVIRNIMLVADEMGFNNGEYIFINIDLFSNKQTLERPWFQLDEAKEKNDRARKAFESMLTVTATKKDSQEYRQFSEEVRKRSVQMYQKDVYGDEVNDYVGSFHDALLLYSLAVNETIQAGLSPRDGQEITKRMWNKTFKGITGLVSIDQNGDREEDYSILNMNPEDGVFRVIGNYLGRQKVFEKVEGSPIFWPGNRTDPPPDIPKCGFDGKGCPPKEKLPVSAFVAVALSIILLIVLLVVFVLYRRMKEEAELSEVHWRVKWEEITSPNSELHMDRVGSMHSLKGSIGSHASFDTLAVSETGPRQIFTKTGHYKSTVVAIKTFDRPFNSTKPLLISIKKLRDLTNDHVARFIGVCIDPPNQSIITEYCQKGSLQDVLENDSIKLDRMFKFSLIQDLIRGMCYLHSSDIKYHGNLKSSNCVVDSRFVLKVTDFGLLELRSRRSSHDVDSFAYYRSKLWTAPEILRMEDNRKCADSTSRINLYEKSHLFQKQSKVRELAFVKGDVYSFAIICQEVVHRKGVFWVRNVENISPHEIYLLVKSDKKPCFRPTLLQYGDDSDDTCADDLCTLIQRSWTEDPNERPDFNQIKNSVKRMNKDMGGGNLLDNLLSRMEQYACNLEGLVQERTADYLEQKKRAENLLYMMLPRSVATQLMQGMNVKAEKYESVTIYFSDICGFTSLSALSTPMQVVDLLNDLYTSFDVIIEKFDVYKVETIGDAYMVVSGLPVRNGLLHAREICRMSLKLLKEVKSFKIRHMPSDKLMLRIGVHSGAVCAGVVGHKMPRYCLFGDTVNTASRMESNGEALKIHVSPETKATLDMFGTFKLEFRGPVVMKGKGEICTWWLMGEENPEFPELSPAEMHL